ATHASCTNAAPPSLQEQLEAQYPVARITTQGGCTVTNPQTALALQKPGIGALPQKTSSTMCASHYRNGAITKTGFKCNYFLNASKQTMVTLEKGDKVFPTKLEVGRDEVKIAFGYCSGDPGQASVYTGQVVIELPKDSLKTPDVTQVEDKIAEVFNPDGGNQQDPAANGDGKSSSSGNQPAPDNTQPVPQEAPSIELGQTMEQVVSALGPPQKKVNLGAKQIYVYKDLKVTFIGGKVADVQ
ncbi:MAG TPA: hypothetical protein VN223_04430, partial [Candidatus Elarobacter sp.]|nr:hypothetical protein [Candidatus Elarobacter sp.]